MQEPTKATIAALLAFNAMLVRELTTSGAVDVADVLSALDDLMGQSGVHPDTVATLTDQHELLLGVLGGGADGRPQVIRADEL